MVPSRAADRWALPGRRGGAVLRSTRRSPPRKRSGRSGDCGRGGPGRVLAKPLHGARPYAADGYLGTVLGEGPAGAPLVSAVLLHGNWTGIPLELERLVLR